MKVILLQDVKNLGKNGDIVETAEGYGRNFLLPRKMAKEATTANLNQAKKDQATAKHRAAQAKDEAVVLGAQVEKVVVVLKVRVGENGRNGASRYALFLWNGFQKIGELGKSME